MIPDLGILTYLGQDARMESHLWREEKYQTWSSTVFPFGGFSHPTCQVLAHRSPLESPLPPPLLLGSSGLCLSPLTADASYLGVVKRNVAVPKSFCRYSP